jgi:ankyrin repeat protein
MDNQENIEDINHLIFACILNDNFLLLKYIASKNIKLDIVAEGMNQFYPLIAVDGKTPLILAAIGHDKNIYNLVLKHPTTDVNARTEDGRTALHYIIDFDDEDAIAMAEEFIKHDKFIKEESYLSYAFASESSMAPSIASSLVQQGIEVSEVVNPLSYYQQAYKGFESLLKQPVVRAGIAVASNYEAIATGAQVVSSSIAATPNIMLAAGGAAIVTAIYVGDKILGSPKSIKSDPMEEEEKDFVHVPVSDQVAAHAANPIIFDERSDYFTKQLEEQRKNNGNIATAPL